jgi:hypothetical protein
MGLQFCGAQNGVKMGVLNAPRRAIWICSVVSLTAFLIFFCFPVYSFYPLYVDAGHWLARKRLLLAMLIMMYRIGNPPPLRLILHLLLLHKQQMPSVPIAIKNLDRKHINSMEMEPIAWLCRS